MFCNACGADLGTRSTKFCSHCGALLKAQPPEPAGEPPPLPEHLLDVLLVSPLPPLVTEDEDEDESEPEAEADVEPEAQASPVARPKKKQRRRRKGRGGAKKLSPAGLSGAAEKPPPLTEIAALVLPPLSAPAIPATPAEPDSFELPEEPDISELPDLPEPSPTCVESPKEPFIPPWKGARADAGDSASAPRRQEPTITLWDAARTGPGPDSRIIVEPSVPPPHIRRGLHPAVVFGSAAIVLAAALGGLLWNLGEETPQTETPSPALPLFTDTPNAPPEPTPTPALIEPDAPAPVPDDVPAPPLQPAPSPETDKPGPISDNFDAEPPLMSIPSLPTIQQGRHNKIGNDDFEPVSPSSSLPMPFPPPPSPRKEGAHRSVSPRTAPPARQEEPEMPSFGTFPSPPFPSTEAPPKTPVWSAPVETAEPVPIRSAPITIDRLPATQGRHPDSPPWLNRMRRELENCDGLFCRQRVREQYCKQDRKNLPECKSPSLL